MKHLAVLVLLACLARYPFALHYGPFESADSSGYLELARMIQAQDFAGYDAWRTPGYPLILALFHSNLSGLVVFQAGLGILNSILIYGLLRFLKCRPGVALGYGLLVAGSINFLVFDFSVLTETLAMLLVTAIAFCGAIAAEKRSQAVRWSVALGLLASAAFVVRPQNMVFLPVIAGWMLLPSSIPFKTRGIAALCYSAIFLAAIFALLEFNARHAGARTISTTSGINFRHHALPFIEDARAADNLGLLPEIIRLRDEYWSLSEAAGDYRALIPSPRVPGATTAKQTSDYYLKLSLEAFRQRPLRYAASVLDAWTRFWRVSLVFAPEASRSGRLTRVVQTLWPATKLMWVGISFIFLLVAVRIIWRKWRMEPVLLMVLVAGTTSLMTSIGTHGDNARLAVPFLPLCGVVVISGWKTFWAPFGPGALRSNRQPPQETRRG